MGEGGIIFIFILFVLLIIGAAIYSAIAARKRREELFELATRLGLDFSAANNYGLAERFGFLDKLARGSNRYACNVISGAYRQNQVLVFAENYPQLKADQQFLKLQQELITTENRIQAARRFYNGNVRDYRNKCETFPSNLVAQMFGFQPREFFSVPPSVKEVPDVEFAR